MISASEISVQPSGRMLPSCARAENGRSSKTVKSDSPHDLRPFRSRLARQQLEDVSQVAQSGLEGDGGFLDEVLGLREVVVVERLVAEPLEAVDLEIARADLADRERAPAVLQRVPGGAAGAPIRIGAVAGLERLEMGV